MSETDQFVRSSHNLSYEHFASENEKKRLSLLSDNLFNTGEAGIEPALTVLETAFLPLEDSPISFLDANTHPQNRTYKSDK